MLTDFDIGDLVLVKRRIIKSNEEDYLWYLHGIVVAQTGSYGSTQWIKVHTEDGRRWDYRVDQMILLARASKD